ncbi:MAG: hypothetical protein ACK4SR_07755 [Thiobacillus sp.]
MLWLFLVLQSLAPFIHAHTGATSPHLGGPLHFHQTAAEGGAAGEALAADALGTEITVAAGLRWRNDDVPLPPDMPPAGTRPVSPACAAYRHACSVPRPDSTHALVLHLRPFALAPPLA